MEMPEHSYERCAQECFLYTSLVTGLWARFRYMKHGAGAGQSCRDDLHHLYLPRGESFTQSGTCRHRQKRRVPFRKSTASVWADTSNRYR